MYTIVANTEPKEFIADLGVQHTTIFKIFHKKQYLVSYIRLIHLQLELNTTNPLEETTSGFTRYCFLGNFKYFTTK